MREFGTRERVITCKGKSGEAPNIRGSKDATNQKPPVASTATARGNRTLREGAKEKRKMKRQAYRLIAMIVLIGSMAVAAQAQNSGRPLLRVYVPFQFNVGNKTLPAGDYLVGSVNDSSPNVVLSIQSSDGKAGAMLMMRSVQGKTPDRAKLMFNRYGNQFFFAQTWVGGRNIGLEAPRSRAERVAQRELAGMKPVITMVALKSR